MPTSSENTDGTAEIEFTRSEKPGYVHIVLTEFDDELCYAHVAEDFPIRDLLIAIHAVTVDEPAKPAVKRRRRWGKR